MGRFIFPEVNFSCKISIDIKEMGKLLESSEIFLSFLRLFFGVARVRL